MKSRRVRRAGQVARMGERERERKEKSIQYLENLKGLENNIKMDARKTGWEGADWMYLAQDTGQ
jgi:hypothetical protein